MTDDCPQELIIFKRLAFGLLSFGLVLAILQGPVSSALSSSHQTSKSTVSTSSSGEQMRLVASGPSHAKAKARARAKARAKALVRAKARARAKAKAAKAAKARALAKAKARARALAVAKARAAATASGTKHFVTNLHGSKAPAGLGFNVFDIGSGDWALSTLPSGVQGLVYLGQKCPTPADAAFKRTVDRLAKSPKVFGYYLSDEPHIKDCAAGPAALASRADYIRRATNGAQKSFVVLSKSEDYRPFRPAATHVDLVGLDPYPCSVANPGCEFAKVGEKVSSAKAAGIPLSTIVPVFQAFGQSGLGGDKHYYNLPTTGQMTALLAAWDKWVPNPVMDYTYSWGNQGSSNPTLVDSPGLQQLFKQRFGR